MSASPADPARALPLASLAQALHAQVAARVMRQGPALAQRAAGLGLALTGGDGVARPIPVAALPLVLPDAEIAQRGRTAQVLAHATAKAARWRLQGPHRAAVLAAVGPTERRLLQSDAWRSDALAVARVDMLGAAACHALEVNATIPAMQGYSDIAARAWLEWFAPRPAQVDALAAANGSNATALLAALGALYRAARGTDPGRIGLLCRRGDAQLTELRFLRDRFRAAGVAAEIVYPDQLASRAGVLADAGGAYPLLYRHLFLARLDAAAAPALEAALADPARGTLVLNRPAPHLEMKSTLALLSAALESDALREVLGLTDTERDTIARSVPWTRWLAPQSDAAPAQRAAWVAAAAAAPDEYVLKRSWSYGGHEVFVGRARHEAGFAARAQAAFPGVRDWGDLVARAAAETRGDGFVLQRALPRDDQAQWLCTPDAVQATRVVTDYAAFASIGAEVAWGGVSRAAASDIVNIVGGGAVVPVIRASVAARVLQPAPEAR